MSAEDDPLNRIEAWVLKFEASLEEQVALGLQASPESSETQLREKWLLNKIATLQVGLEELGKELRALEAKESSSDT